MNVLYLTNNAGRASTTVATKGWFQHLVVRGLRPVIVSPILGEFADWARNQYAIKTYQLTLPFPSKRVPFSFLATLWRLRQIVKRHGIELIHCNEQDVYPIGQYLARLCGLPVVVSVHFTMSREFCLWAFGGRRCPDRIFFISRGNVEACRPGVEDIIPEDRWRLLYNGLDLGDYSPDQERRAAFRSEHGLDGDIAIGVACALRPRKQLEHLFDAAARIDDEKVKVLVAGAPMPGDEQYAQSLLDHARARLGSRLILLGHLDELRSFYNGLDVFVNTSREEACSVSIIESLACGCPVLGYPSKSVDDQVVPHGGEIVEQDSVDDLACTLRRWIGEETTLAKRRVSARTQAEERFDIGKLADQLWSEYERLLNERRRAR